MLRRVRKEKCVAERPGIFTCGPYGCFSCGNDHVSCMNRIFGSKWVDNTITPSDLLASALQAVVYSVNMSSTT